MKCALLYGCLCLPLCALGAPRWTLQYFYDVSNSTLVINDLKFTSPTRGMAVGFLRERDKVKPAAVATDDGGKNWRFLKVPDGGLSLFFLDDHVGWLVTPRAVWATRSGGQNWTKLGHTPPHVTQVYFLDEKRGWAIGTQKSAYETSDGGASWARLAALKDLNTSAEFTQFWSIDFVNRRVGVITGGRITPSSERRNFREPKPDEAPLVRERPSVSIILETRDGGRTWRVDKTSMFGRITRLRLLEEGRGMMLIEFLHAFEWPSEVFELDWQHGAMRRIFRAKDCAITDVAPVSGQCGYLAGVEATGLFGRSAVPSKVRIYQSANWTEWSEMDVDYRAIATRVVLAVADGRHVWAATDTGMILRLSE